MCLTQKEQKEAISIPVSGKDLLAVFPTGFGKSPIVQVLIRMKEILAGKPSNVVVVCPLLRIVYAWANGISILDRINGSYAHGLLFGGYIVRQISTRINISGKRFGEAIFFVDEEKENNHTVFLISKYFS